MVNADAIKERVLESQEKEDEKSIRERVAERFNQSQNEKSFEEKVREGVSSELDKNRVYVDSEEDVPDQYTAQTSDRGAVYYETGDGGSSARAGVSPSMGNGDDSGPGSIETEEAVDHFEDFVDDIDVANPQDEYEEEAAQLWSDYTQGMMSDEEFDEEVVNFIQEYADETMG